MKAKEIDKRFDRGEDITKHLVLGKARRPGLRKLHDSFKKAANSPIKVKK
jgi:hypothetical protein